MEKFDKLNTLLTLSIGMTADKRALFERISFIGRRPRALAWVSLAVALAALTMGVVACSDGVGATMPEGTPSATPTPEASALPAQADGLSASPTAMPEENGAFYELFELNSGGEILYYAAAEDEAGRALAKEMIGEYEEAAGNAAPALTPSPTPGPAPIPGSEAEAYDYFLLRETNEGVKREYYIYSSSAGEFIRDGETGLQSRISERSYQKLIGYLASAGQEAAAAYIGFDRKEMAGAAEEFLTRYFDDICEGNTDWGYNAGTGAFYKGLVLQTEYNSRKLSILRQWISYKAFLAEAGYDREGDSGRFSSLEVASAGILDGLVSGEEFTLEGYFKTTAFGTYITLCFAQNAEGEYQITSVAFPDWKEFNDFSAGFTEYMEKNGYEDYNKSMYIDSLRRGRDEALNAWKSGERASEEFSLNRSIITITATDAFMNSNGAEQIESMAESNFAGDRFARPGEEALLTVSRCLRGTVEQESLIEHAIENFDFGAARTYGRVELAPEVFFGGETEIASLTKLTARSYEEAEGGGVIEKVETVYYALLPYTGDPGNGEDMVLIFRFLNAREDGEGGWLLYQSGEDCREWMKTLKFYE